MAEEARIGGINWRETFPFTHLFRSFRIAIHPSKLALGLIALLCLYLGGLVLDAIWPTRHRAVPNEVVMYQDVSAAGGSAAAFRRERASRREEIEQHYTYKLEDLKDPKIPDRGAAIEAARHARFTDRVMANSIARRNSEISDANHAYNAAVAEASKLSGADRDVAIVSAQAARDARVVAAYEQTSDDLRLVNEVRGNGLFSELFEYETAQVNRVVNGVISLNWLGGLRKDTPSGVVRSIINFFAVGPLWLMWNHPIYFILYGLLFLTVWAIFGGAIARIAAVHVARDEKLSVRAALSFSGAKFLSFVSAPLIPIIIILLVGLVPLVAGLLSSIPYIGPLFYILMGALFIVLLAAGFVMTLVLIGLVTGLNLMYPTIAVEGSDSFDAISRSFSYVYARPWRMIFYTAIAVVYGALTYLFVRFFIYLMLALTHRFVGAGMFVAAPSTEPLWPNMWRGPSATGTLGYTPNFLTLRWDQDLAAILIAFWVYLLIAVLGAFAISFYFTANTIIYYLMRNEVDATEMDDVYLEQSDEDFAEALAPPATATTAGAGASAAVNDPEATIIVNTTTIVTPEPPPPPASA